MSRDEPEAESLLQRGSAIVNALCEPIRQWACRAAHRLASPCHNQLPQSKLETVLRRANHCVVETFFCGKSRRGKFLLHRKTRRDRLQAKLSEIREELRRQMHLSIPEQGQWLRQVMTGYFAYHAVPTNGRALRRFRNRVIDLWRRTLLRRSQKDRTTWARMAKLASDLLPKVRILHPWPSDRFFGKYPRWEPSA